MKRSTRTDIQRFCEKFTTGPALASCWPWHAARDADGYGKFCGKRPSHRQWYAHRFAYEAFVGPIPTGLVLDHLCRNRYCVNPAHLQPVHIGTNILRGVTRAARNAAKTHCMNGHPLSGDNLERRPDNSRQCRICVGVKSRAYYWRVGREALMKRREDPEYRRIFDAKNRERKRMMRRHNKCAIRKAQP